MESDEEIELAAISFFKLPVAHTHSKRKKNRVKRLWVKPWMARKEKNVYNNLIQGMRLEDGRGFYEYHRISRKNFQELLNLVAGDIQRQDTHLRSAIPPEQRLSVTLRYLATGKPEAKMFSYTVLIILGKIKGIL